MWLAAVLVLVSGCYRDKGANQSVRCIVVALGDSLTSGAGESTQMPYTAFLEQTLQEAGYPCTVINEGVAGDTTAAAIDRVPAIVARRPTVTIVELGGNDGLARRDVAQIEANLSTIVQMLVASRIPVVLAGVQLPPEFDPEYARRFARLYGRVAQRYHVAMVPSIVDGLEQPGLLQDDGIHPTIKGNKRLAENVQAAVLETLKSSNLSTSP